MGGEDAEVVLLAVERRDVRGERVGAVLPLGRLELEGNTDEQAMQVRDAIRVLFPEAVTLVREAREGLS